MADKREAVLVRLLEIAAAVPGIVRVSRNDPVVGEDSSERPLIQIFDGDEVADPSDPVHQRPRGQPRRVAMTPHIYLMLGAPPEDVGTIMNALRATLLKAILTDATIAGIIGTTGSIQYDGCTVVYARGRTMEGEMLVSVTFNYGLVPSDL